MGAAVMMGPQIDGACRFPARGEDIGQMCLLGTFSEYTVVPEASLVKIDAGTPLDKAALIGAVSQRDTARRYAPGRYAPEIPWWWRQAASA
jgi:S-(hydroxymethyl)glutathione dehydrogenase/alcohol dehydrogenase